MAGPLLETKIHVPRRRRSLVARPRLHERLDRGAGAALILVSAPAGFGKTTLVAEWLAAEPSGHRATAWLSLDERDDDPTRFWTYVVAAVQAAAPDVGAGALSILTSAQSSIDAALASLLNDLQGLPHDVVLVLDDYHAIGAADVHAGMAFLVEHLPHQVHLVIASRSDPALPLARLRARGELVEVRAADLRFTADDAAAYLNDVMGLALTAADIARLEGRTEGWIAALQLAALSMQGRDDVAGFIADFAGDDRFIVDYLVGEVLERQPDDVRRFLLETCVLRRLSGPLCDAVTGRDGGAAMLEALERRNLFLVPLDDRRRWYRYHHLFADVLRARLLDEQPDLVPELHRRASGWCARHGDPSEAIAHALAAGDADRAADLVELALPEVRRAKQVTTLHRWLDALPHDVVRVRPTLGAAAAGTRMSRGALDDAEAHLDEAERWVEQATAGRGPEVGTAGMVVVDDEGFRALPGTIAMYRAALAHLRGDVAGTMAHARRALDVAGDAERGGAASLLGLAHWADGDLEAAHRWYGDGMALLERAGYHPDVVGGAVTLADLRIAQGRLREAMAIYERGLRKAMELASPIPRGAADMHDGMGALLVEGNDLVAAAAHLQASRALGEQAGFAQHPHRWPIAVARLRTAEGDLDAALDLLDEAERRYVGDFSPEIRPIAAMSARLRIVRGDLDDALAWARRRQVGVEDDLTYLREFEHVTLARLLLARHAADGDERCLADAVRLLGRLLAAAEAGRRAGSTVEILALQAVALRERGDVPAALGALGRSLDLGGPEGYVRVFLDEGPPMLGLLRTAVQRGVAVDAARHVLGSERARGREAPARRGPVDPLSDRELDVLRLLRTDLSGPEIAGELMVSLNTMRTHTKSIYSKLGVTSRRAAVRRAEELDL